MKKTLILIFSLVGILLTCSLLIYTHLPKVVSFFLSKDFGFKVQIQQIDLHKKGINLYDLAVFNLKPSKYNPALSCQTVEIDTSLKQLRQKRLTIDRIWLSQIDLNIQFYDKAKKNSNFNEIIDAKLAQKPNQNHKQARPYLIKALILDKIDVKLIFYNGKEQTVHIDRLVFKNISEQSGFPVDQLEKAILHAILRQLFQQLNIDNIIKGMYYPKVLIPSEIPNIIPFL